MAEVVLAAEVGRPLGSRAVRRLRREGKIPGVIYGHGTDPVPVAVGARELRVALNSEAGANQLLSLDTGSGTFLTIAREMQRHPVAQTVTHVDFVIVRRDEVISADVPITVVGEAIEVHHGDGLVEQQMFTLPINALPSDIPTAIEADVERVDHRRAGPGLRPRAATRRHHGRRARIDRRRRSAATGRRGGGSGGRGPRRSSRGRGSGGRAGRGGIRGHVRRGLGTASALCPVRAPGHTGGLARRRAGQPGNGVRREPAQRGLRHRGAIGRAARRVLARREGCGGAGGRRHSRAAGGWRSRSRRPI